MSAQAHIQYHLSKKPLLNSTGTVERSASNVSLRRVYSLIRFVCANAAVKHETSEETRTLKPEKIKLN